MDEIRFEGWLSAEYVPSGRTEDSLAWFAPYAGKGHLTDAVSMAIEVAFTQLRLHRYPPRTRSGMRSYRAMVNEVISCSSRRLFCCSRARV